MKCPWAKDWITTGSRCAASERRCAPTRLVKCIHLCLGGKEDILITPFRYYGRFSEAFQNTLIIAFLLTKCYIWHHREWEKIINLFLYVWICIRLTVICYKCNTYIVMATRLHMFACSSVYVKCQSDGWKGEKILKWATEDCLFQGHMLLSKYK